jgi:hypothetical protein
VYGLGDVPLEPGGERELAILPNSRWERRRELFERGGISHRLESPRGPSGTVP